MATNITDNTKKFHPVRNEMKITAFSSEQYFPNVSNFKNIFDLYINDNIVYTFEVVPDENGNSIIDISNVCLSYSFIDTLDTLAISGQDTAESQKNINSLYLDVYGKFTNTTDGQEYTIPNEYTELKYFFSGELSIPDFLNYDYRDFVFGFNIDGAAKFLTSYNTDIPIGLEEDYFLSMFFDGVYPTILRVNVTYKNGSNSTHDISLSIGTFPITYGKRQYHFNVGTTHLTTKSINFNNVNFYTVQLIGSPDVSEIKKFKVYEYNNCEQKRIFWNNNLSGIDAMTFSSRNIDNFSFERTFYKQNINTDVNSLQIKSNTELNIKTTKDYDISTKLFRKEYINALRSMLESYYIYLYTPNAIKVNTVIPDNLVIDYYDLFYNGSNIFGAKLYIPDVSPYLGSTINHSLGTCPSYFPYPFQYKNPGFVYGKSLDLTYDIEGSGYIDIVTSVFPNNASITGVGVNGQVMMGVYDNNIFNGFSSFDYTINEFDSPYTSGTCNIVGFFGSTYVITDLDLATVYPVYDPLDPSVNGTFTLQPKYPSPTYEWVNLHLDEYIDSPFILNPYSGNTFFASYSTLNFPVTLNITDKEFTTGDNIRISINDNSVLKAKDKVKYYTIISKAGNDYTVDIPNLAHDNTPLNNIANVYDTKTALIPLNAITANISENKNDKNYITFSCVLKETW